MAVSKVIIVAGGHSRRMNGIDKIFAEIAGKPVILPRWTRSRIRH